MGPVDLQHFGVKDGDKMRLKIDGQMRTFASGDAVQVRAHPSERTS